MENDKNSKAIFPILQEEDVWYKNGVRFACTGCGKCCTGFSGYVWVTEEEIENIATYLSLEKQQFCREYLRYINGRYSLKEKGEDFDCQFLEHKKFCSIYNVRPKQCRTFPFWDSILSTPENWENAKKMCEGISDSAQIVSFEEINDIRN